MNTKKLRHILGRISPKLLTHLLYYKSFHKVLNLKHPKTLNEVIHWMKFYGDISEWSNLSDKYRVRDFITQKGYADTLIPLIGHWDSASDIEWDKLPSQFVLKANNGCGDILICKDKESLNINKITEEFNNYLTSQFGITTGQTHYKDIKPCVVAEKVLDCTKQAVKSSSLIDYKLWCINGEPQAVFICTNRTKHSLEIAVYDMNWIEHPEYCVYNNHFLRSKQHIPKPLNFTKMIYMSRDLAKGHPQVRVDLYEVDGKIYFGELTFTSACGFMTYLTEDFLTQLGEKTILPTFKRL